MTCWARINTTALKHNLHLIQSYSPHSKIMAMLKANAYGHGALSIIQHLENVVDAIGVARLDEAVALYESGVRQRIVLLEGFSEPAQLELASQCGFESVIHHRSQIEILDKACLAQPIRAWIKVDTGMHRLGFEPQAIPGVFETLSQCPNVQGDLHLMTHFARADDVAHPYTQKQIVCFEETTKHLPGPKSLANSAAIMSVPEAHADWVRPGIMLYGVSPFETSTGDAWNLKPVMTLGSELIAIRDLKQGDPVGYGGTWVAPKACRMGIVAAGYGDGYPRYVESGTPVLIHGYEVPLIGRVSMDMMAVDLSLCPEASLGSPVTLWGEGLPVETIARCAQTSPYELLAGVTARVKMRQYQR